MERRDKEQGWRGEDAEWVLDHRLVQVIGLSMTILCVGTTNAIVCKQQSFCSKDTGLTRLKTLATFLSSDQLQRHCMY